jgi:hypothetical protein
MHRLLLADSKALALAGGFGTNMHGQNNDNKLRVEQSD